MVFVIRWRCGCRRNLLIRKDKTIAPLRQSLNKFWVVSRIFKGGTDLLNRCIQAEIKIYEGIGGPYPLLQLLAGHQSSRVIQEQSEDLERLFLKPGGFVPTLIASGQQWDAPNGWAPLEWLAIEGVRRYGRADLADTARARWLALNRRTYRATGKMTEKYDVVDLQLRAGGGE